MKTKYNTKITCIIILIQMVILLACGSKSLNAQSATTLGKDFWVSFMKNHEYTVYSEEVELKLIITGNRSCSGVISNPNTNWQTNFTVTPGVITNVVIPKVQTYTDLSETVTNTGIHIVTTDTVSLYASNYAPYTFDITNVLPTQTLSSKYMIQTYPNTAMSCEFLILATEDNTVVDIKPKVSTQGGHSANQQFSVTLNAGQCYQVISYGNHNDDFSGSTVESRNNKKIAVFQGNKCVVIPDNYGYCDHIIEQSMPVEYWGKTFLVTTSEMRTHDVVRVTSLNNNCQIRKNGQIVSTINEGQTYEFQMQYENEAALIETTEPACVYLYFTGSDYGGANGAPSMVIINPIEQEIDEVTFGSFTTEASNYHYVNIVTKTANKSGMILDGTNISSRFTCKYPNCNTQLFDTRQLLRPNSHRRKHRLLSFL